MTPRVCSALQICRIGSSLRILRIISMQKIDLPILIIKTDFVMCKICQKLNQFSQVIQELIKTSFFLLHWGSYIYDVHKKWSTLWPIHPQKLTIDLSFNNDRIRKHVTNFKTPPFHFHVDVINVWSLAPQTFKTNHLTYLSVVLRFKKRKWKNVQCFKISADSAYSFCTTN